LHTVKVQNWDKTITTIPTHKLIEQSFKNWRGMSESGGRRIKRALAIDMTTVRFLEEDDIVRFGRLALLRGYMEDKRQELRDANASRDPAVAADLRRLTNLGTFRAYLWAYLRAHRGLHQTDMTLLVRQLPPSSKGLPIEIYCFTRDTDWIRYEEIQSDIFDHFLAIAPEFSLRVFQEPSGGDFARAFGQSSEGAS
ncbi:MAG: mechanosensitive ion channel family protein, partial [Proteobacteria bacterium]|nr:mechanosensitive ion channel family protein [Pseudomonadota bacterium]